MSEKRTSKKAKLLDPNTTANLDERTTMVFIKKGYEVLTILGAGSFGEVYKAIRKATNELCAVKVIDLLRCSIRYRKKFLPRELVALMDIRHENIIRVYDIFRSNKKIFIFMEFASNGDLAKYLKKHGPLEEEKACFWFKQIVKAIHYLHREMFMAHRDIKIDNILLNEQWIVKLTDFGFVTEAIDNDGRLILSETFCGTLPYYCVQILQKSPYNPYKADIWAMGVLLYAMTHNRFPFHYKDTKMMLKEQKSETYMSTRFHEHASSELRDLVLKMFEIDEEKRISTAQILAHDWMQINNHLIKNKNY